MHIRPDQQRIRPGRRRGPLLAAAAALGIAAAGLMSAASASAAVAADPLPSSSGTTTANVNVTSDIILSGLTEAFTLEGFPGQSPEDIGAVTFSVFTNNTDGYNVTVEAEAANLTAAGSNTDVIPVADIGVRETDTATYTALSSTATVTVHSQETRSAELPGDALSNDYAFINPIPDVKSDLYSDVLDYVATVNP